MLYLDYTLDESYTPKKIAVSVGMCRDDIEGGKVEVVEVNEPNGWVEIWVGEMKEIEVSSMTSEASAPSLNLTPPLRLRWKTTTGDHQRCLRTLQQPPQSQRRPQPPPQPSHPQEPHR